MNLQGLLPFLEVLQRVRPLGGTTGRLNQERRGLARDVGPDVPRRDGLLADERRERRLVMATRQGVDPLQRERRLLANPNVSQRCPREEQVAASRVGEQSDDLFTLSL